PGVGNRTMPPPLPNGTQLAAQVALRRTNKFLQEGIAQTHQLLSLLHQRAAATPSDTVVAANVGGDQTVQSESLRRTLSAGTSDMDIILLTTQLLCSWQAASSAVQSVPAFSDDASQAASDSTSTACQRKDCRDQIGKLRIRLAAALSEVSMLQGHLKQPFVLPEPRIPVYEEPQPSHARFPQGQGKKSVTRSSHSSVKPTSHVTFQDDFLPPRKRQRSSVSTVPFAGTAASQLPPPRKPHGFPDRLAAAAKCYASSRYTNGRMSLTTSPSTTVLAHILVPPRKLSQSTIQGYVSTITTSMGSVSELMNTVLAAITTSDSTHPRTIAEIYARHQPPESAVKLWARYTLRWSVRPMVAVKVLDHNQPEVAPHWRSLLDSLSPAEQVYIQGKNPRMVLMVGVDWIGYPEGMFADSPSPDVYSTRVALCERYGLVVGDVGPVPDVAISIVDPPHPPRRPTSAYVFAPPHAPTHAHPSSGLPSASTAASAHVASGSTSRDSFVPRSPASYSPDLHEA
ncbi:hypothetical protein BCR44DRAFT_277804, partial [Catenaria anguillulae PL171]